MRAVDRGIPEAAHGLDDFEDFFRREYRPAFRVANRILGNVTEAEDVAAEALARALALWHQISHLRYREAWVLRVATNAALDVARRKPRGSHSPEPGEFEDALIIRVALVTALETLPKRQREVIMLRYLAGLPEDDVASCLGLSVNSVKKHRQRGIAVLRARLGSGLEGVEALGH